MKTKSLLMAVVVMGAALGFTPAPAQAQDYCREYTRTVYIGNREQVAYGTACYQPNGDWKIVDETDRSRIGQRFRNEDVTSSYYQPVYQPIYQPHNRSYYYRPVPQPTRIVFATGNGNRHYGYAPPHRGPRYDHRGPDRWHGHDRDRDRGRHHR